VALELERAFDLLYSILHGDSAIVNLVADRIYDSTVPQNPTFPYVLIEYVSGEDIDGTGTVRLMTTPLMLIRAVNKGIVTSDMLTIDGQIDALLQSTVAKPGSGYTFSIRRERPFRRPYYDDDHNRFSEIGGFYRLYIS
jgi:hypothetical protein